MRNLILISAVLCAGLLYLLSSSSVNARLFSVSYYTLLGLTGTLALFLLVLVGYQCWSLRNKLKSKVFGAKLTLRLVMFFTLIAVLPGMLVYAVSVQFLSKSIESWFNVSVEKALEGGLNLGRHSLDNSLEELNKKTQFVALVLADKHSGQYQHALDQIIEEKVAQEASLFSAGGNLIAFSSQNPNRTGQIPTREQLVQVLRQQHVAQVDSEDDGRLTLRTLVRVNSNLDPNSRYVLQFVQTVPNDIAQNVSTVESIYLDYQQLAISREGLKQLYAITLTLSLLVVLLTAMSIALYISERIGSSLEALAEGTRAVAQGDFTGQRPIQSSDELGALTSLFNQMTRQLFEAKQVSEQQRREIESAKSHLESVLTHLSSGVLALDAKLALHSVNTSAADILSVPLEEMLQRSLSDIAEKNTLLSGFCTIIVEAFKSSPDGEWQRQIERMSRNGTQILLIRGTCLPAGGEASFVVVFDDISHLLQAERQAAWGEVARRLAHEIKNPLTPIQLSAERLQHKLSRKLATEDAELLQRATQTIVSQVLAMKNMVSDFADYARAPTSKLQLLDLHALIREILGLYDTSGGHIVLQLEAARCQISGDSTRIRQVIHNLLQNAQDATLSLDLPRITIYTETRGRQIALRFEDNGPGFSQLALSRAFEPYMTTKTKGTGLGLAIVKKIIEEHGGQIAIENSPQGGARINMLLPLVENNNSGNAQQMESLSHG